jgi:hypothetical protein
MAGRAGEESRRLALSLAIGRLPAGARAVAGISPDRHKVPPAIAAGPLFRASLAGQPVIDRNAAFRATSNMLRPASAVIQHDWTPTIPARARRPPIASQGRSAALSLKRIHAAFAQRSERPAEPPPPIGVGADENPVHGIRRGRRFGAHQTSHALRI